VSLREQILGSRPKLVPVECPAWGCTVWVDGSLTLADRLELARVADGDEDTARKVVRAVIVGARTEDGSRLFSAEDAEAVAALDGATLERISEALLRANGWTAEGAEAARKN
jgi:hypothetical protein